MYVSRTVISCVLASSVLLFVESSMQVCTCMINVAILCLDIFSVFAFLSTIACAWCITIIARDTDRVVYVLPCINKWDTYVLSVYTKENKCKSCTYCSVWYTTGCTCYYLWYMPCCWCVHWYTRLVNWCAFNVHDSKQIWTSYKMFGLCVANV